jgi:hypothetical protein
MGRLAWIAIAVTASIFAAVTVWSTRFRPRADAELAPVSAAAPSAAADAVEPLRAELEAERRARVELETQVAALREQLAEFTAPAATPTSTSEMADESGDAETPATPAPELAANAQPEGDESENADADPHAPKVFDDAVLAKLGLPDHEIERLREAWDAKEMEILYLRDQALREGWARKPRFQAQSNRIENHLRDELGDEDYDRVLCATGRNNRPRVQGVLSGSPAERVGLESGDIVYAYNGSRVFRPQDLPRAVVNTDPGTVVTLDVVRKGEPQRLRIGAGPMGVQLGATRVPCN